jgi:hypothetical protein
MGRPGLAAGIVAGNAANAGRNDSKTAARIVRNESGNGIAGAFNCACKTRFRQPNKARKSHVGVLCTSIFSDKGSLFYTPLAKCPKHDFLEGNAVKMSI